MFVEKLWLIGESTLFNDSVPHGNGGFVIKVCDYMKIHVSRTPLILILSGEDYVEL